MADSPPPLPTPNLRLAKALNVFLPGAGLFYLGQRKAGALLAGSFLGCFVGCLAVFLVGYVQYFNISLGGDILAEGQLERIQQGFHPRWIVGFMIAGLLLYIFSSVLFRRVKKKFERVTPLPRLN